MNVALMALLATTFNYSVDPAQGLTVWTAGVPVVRGSSFQYYEPGWSKGYFSSVYSGGLVKVHKPNEETTIVDFKSQDGLAHGRITYTREGSKLRVHNEFRWDGPKPVNVELTSGMLWAPALKGGAVSLDGAQPVPLDPPKEGDMNQRRVGPDAKTLIFTGPIGKVSIDTSHAITSFDARGYPQEYARKRELYWDGILALPVSKEAPAVVDLTWTFEPVTPADPTKSNRDATETKDSSAQTPMGEALPLIPKPKLWSPRGGWAPIGTAVAGPGHSGALVVRLGAALREGLGQRFSGPLPTGPMVVFGPSPTPLPPEGYEIDVAAGRISLTASDDAGYMNGIRRLALMAVPQNGHLAVPSGHMRDWPTVGWRGIHLFVGPAALDFHQKLWDRVLLPLGFNHVVLECERTEWSSMPNLRGGINMRLADLAKLFDWYRSQGVEPIPLVQSFGHMDWFFSNDGFLDLAMDKNLPYAVDPRKPATKEILEKLWKEVVAVTHAKTIHFGCDEVDMLGWPGDSALTTDLWKLQLPELGRIADQNGVKGMIWGDMALAPDEAIDAGNGIDDATAKARRAAIPKSIQIADWHYRGEPNPAPFRKSLQTWKSEGYTPIAASWFDPRNICGYTQAAIQEHCGTLQTSWAGYESSEAELGAAAEQFTSFVAAADYAWSGRTDLPDQLGYDPAEVFRQLYFDPPQPLSPRAGEFLTWGAKSGEKRIGGIRFSIGEPLTLHSVLAGSDSAPSEVTLKCKATSGVLWLAMDTRIHCDENEHVGDLLLHSADGTEQVVPIRYGQQVRAATDPDQTVYSRRADNLSILPVSLAKPVVAITFRSANTYAGLRVIAATVVHK